VEQVAANPGREAGKFLPDAIPQIHDIPPAATGAGCHSWEWATNQIDRIPWAATFSAAPSFDVNSSSADDLTMGRARGTRNSLATDHPDCAPSGF
jgi:hypothetical protein